MVVIKLLVVYISTEKLGKGGFKNGVKIQHAQLPLDPTFHTHTSFLCNSPMITTPHLGFPESKWFLAVAEAQK